MKIIVNDQPRQVDDNLSLESLIKNQECHPETIVAAVNEVIIEPAKYSETILAENDRIELVAFVGGG